MLCLEIGKLVCLGSAWPVLEKRLFRHWFDMQGKIHEEVHKNYKKCKTWVQSRADIWTTRCPIGTEQRWVSQELMEEEKRMRFVERGMARATLQAL